MKCKSSGKMGDLFGKREDHLACMRILLEYVVHPQLDAQALGGWDLSRRNDPGTQGTSTIETFLANPVVSERRTFRYVWPHSKIASGEIVGDCVTGDVVQR